MRYGEFTPIPKRKKSPEIASVEASTAEIWNILRYRGLVSRVVEAFGDEVKASLWLSLPNRDLNGQTPIQVMQANGYDMRALEPIITRIEHGIDY
jgi:uncharacterized protein (DUF2384 family)